MKRILLVDQDKENIELITQIGKIEPCAYQWTENEDIAVRKARAWKPHLILKRQEMPPIALGEWIQKVRNYSLDDYTAVVLMCHHLQIDQMLQYLEVGVDDFLWLPLVPERLNAQLVSNFKRKDLQDALKRSTQRVQELNSTDELTGLLNMYAQFRRGEEEILRSKRFRKPVSAFLLNIDGFSMVNQAYGFTAGNQVLQEVADRLRECIRSIDLISRVGADEFFVLLLETDLAGAEYVAERVRDVLQSAPFRMQRQFIHLTACLGVAGLTPDQGHQKMSELFRIATEALRSAKTNGTNRIEVYSFN